MKVLIDTNVILDVLCGRTDFLEDSSKVWKYCEINKIEGYISALSVPNDLKKAAEMKTSDYEDALQMVCANRIKTDFIITRNIRDFMSSKVLAIKPSELLERI